MNSATDLSKLWEAMFGKLPPVAHLLRDSRSDSWVRFHSLPESKRYPENEGEMREVLTRHNAVLNHLAPSNPSLTLLSTGYSDSVSPVSSDLVGKGLFTESTLWCSIPMHEISDNWGDPTYWHISSLTISWKPQALDPVFRLVAQEAVSNIMLISEQGRWLYHPYDGGADVILSTELERDRLKQEYSQWLSSHPFGL